MEEIVIATANPHKVAEMRAIFRGHAISVVGLADLQGRFAEPAEHGSTFEDNACIKAISYAIQTGRMCLADDSGLEVDALHGAPGVISSHYASGGIDDGASREDRDHANNERLLADLAGVPPEHRTARFVCVMCLAMPTSTGSGPRVLASTRGTLEGRIGLPGDVPRGENGFGYDPLFIVDDGRTSAELSPREKNARSHRAAAAEAMAREITRLMTPPMND
jgi:XTP/dITP diphosphohydrolase